MKNDKKMSHLNTNIKKILRYALAVILALCTILLLVNKTRGFLYGVFGFAIYAYLAMILIYLILYKFKVLQSFGTRNFISIVILILSIISIWHVASLRQVIMNLNGIDKLYLSEPYKMQNTVGGLFMSFWSYGFVKITPNYGFVLMSVFVLMAILLFSAIYPLVLLIGRSIKNKAIIKPKDPESEDVMPNIPPSLENIFSDKSLDNVEEEPETDAFAKLFNKREQKKEETELFNSIKTGEDIAKEELSKGRAILFDGPSKEEKKNTPQFKVLDNISEDTFREKESLDDNMGGLFDIKSDDNTELKNEGINKMFDEGITQPVFLDELVRQRDLNSDNIALEEASLEKEVDFAEDEHRDTLNLDPSKEKQESKIVETPSTVIEVEQEIKEDKHALHAKKIIKTDTSSEVEQISLEDYLSQTKESEKEESLEESVKSEKEVVSKPPYKYNYPPLNLLKDKSEKFSGFPEDYDVMKHKIDQTMAEFKVPANVIGAVQGPTFTLYELSLGQGYSVKRLTGLVDNLKMRLEVRNIRLLAPIEGRDAFGIEIPNKSRIVVGLKSLLESERYQRKSDGIDLCFGITTDGSKYIADLTQMPHLLVAGASGTGKSVFLNSAILSILYKYSPEDVRLVLIDPKRVELSKYRNLPNLLVAETIKEQQQAVNALNMLVNEMENRYKIFEKFGCANIKEYNSLNPQNKMYKIVLVIDEMADLMMKSKGTSQVEDNIVRIAQLARACGIHMIIATQRPIVDVITGLIKSNIVCRVAFTVQSATDSRIILDEMGAEELLGKGDMIYSSPGGTVRMQGAYMEFSEINDVCNYIMKNNAPDFDEEFAQQLAYDPKEEEALRIASVEERRSEKISDDENLAQDVMRHFIITERASISSAQTKFAIGYVKAKRIVNLLEERGYLGPEGRGALSRSINLTLEELEELVESDKF